MARRDFGEGVKSFERKGTQAQMLAERKHLETEEVTSADFNRMARFIQSRGALRMLRVLHKLCNNDIYIKTCNWLVFNASLFEAVRFCQLVLSMLRAQPRCPEPHTIATGQSIVSTTPRPKRSSSVIMMTKSVRKAGENAGKKPAFSLLALEEILSFKKWSLRDATPMDIKLLMEDAMEYQHNAASRMLARIWGRYVFRTRIASDIHSSLAEADNKHGTSALGVARQSAHGALPWTSKRNMVLEEENVKLQRRLLQQAIILHALNPEVEVPEIAFA